MKLVLLGFLDEPLALYLVWIRRVSIDVKSLILWLCDWQAYYRTLILVDHILTGSHRCKSRLAYDAQWLLRGDALFLLHKLLVWHYLGAIRYILRLGWNLYRY